MSGNYKLDLGFRVPQFQGSSVLTSAPSPYICRLITRHRNGRVLTPHQGCEGCLHRVSFSGTSEVEVAGIKHGVERDGELTSQ
jgi:hypothetical protein